MAESSINRIKELDRERAKLMDTAKKEALTRAASAVADLNALGFAYRLVDGVARGRPAGTGRRGGRKKMRAKECPLCKFETKPPHDRRAHRFSSAKRRPFTAAELKEKGYVRV